jgi:ribonucleoside-triphosphate reductase
MEKTKTQETKVEPYYTNSSQLPVGYTDDLFEAVELQDSLQTKYTGGTVMHGFIGERLPSGKEAKKIIKKVFEKNELPYFSITPTFSICPTHGYMEGEHFKCPKCLIDQPCEVYSRVVGYLRPVQQWNNGKAQEYEQRKMFKVKK